MSWLACDLVKEAETGMPDGYDALPCLGERTEEPIIDPKKEAEEVKGILDRLKNPPAPPTRKFTRSLLHCAS